ncbi:MAG: TasA family protein [Actinomycetota bacterium]
MTTTVYTPNTASPPRGRRGGLRAFVAASALVGAMLLVSGYVFAQLNATATQTNNANTGTLVLAMTNPGGVGFTTDLPPATGVMAPGDKFVRAVAVTNSGSLAAKDLKLTVTTPATNWLVNATHGLTVAVDSCPSAWTLSGGPPATWGCSVTPTAVFGATPIATIISTPQTIASTVAVNGAYYLRFTIQLPNSPANDETTTNGVIPSPGIQGLTAALTWTFTEIQRDATTVEA